MQHRGKDFELRKIAPVIANGAWQALVYLDWLVVTDAGKRAAETLLAPFLGFAPLPPDIQLKDPRRKRRAS